MRTRLAVLRFVMGVAVLGVAVALPCEAQNVNVTDQTMPQIPSAGHNFLGNLNESVNPANGSVGLRIAMPVPAGRRLTMPFAIGFGNETFPCYQPQGSGGVTGCLSVTPFSADGWSLTVPQLTRFTSEFNPGTRYADQSTKCDATTGYIFRDSSGAQHSMQIANIYNYYSDSTFTTESRACANSYYIQAPNYAPTAGSITTGADPIYSGAFIGLNVWNDYTNTNPNQEGSPTFVDADGTTYSFPNTGYPADWCGLGATQPNGIWGYPQTITDRNGNSAMISYNCAGAPNTFSVTDNIGRTALSASWTEYPASGTTDSVTVAGLSQPYRLTRSNESWSGGYTVTSQPISALEPYPNYCTQVNDPANGQVSGGSAPAVTSITLPNGQSYQISYDPQYGQISQIKYPSGGTVTYTWGVSPLSTMIQFSSSEGTSCAYEYDTLAVTKRVVSFDGVHGALEQDFSYRTNWDPTYPGIWDTKVTRVVTKDLVRGTSFTTVYTYGGTGIEGGPDHPEKYDQQNPWPAATFVPVENEIQYYADPNETTLLKTVWKGWNNPFNMACQIEQIGTNGPVSGVYYTYGAGGQVTDVKEYADITSLPANPSECTLPTDAVTRETVTTYATFPTPDGFAGPVILDRPATVQVWANGTSGTLMSETDYTYDGGTPSVGNATQIKKKCFGCAEGDSTTTYAYDTNGQVVSATDANGNTTTYSYADNYSPCSGNAPATSPSDAYLTQVTYPAVNGVGHQVGYCYDYTTGLLLSSADENGQVTHYHYADSLNRLTETDDPDGGQTTISYNDAPPAPNVATCKKMNGTQSVCSTAIMDGMGHVTETELTSDPAGTDYTATTYDGLGRVYTATNPYRTTSDPTYGVTTYTYDALGRTTNVQHPDGSTIQTTYTGRATEVTDEGNGTRSVQRISQTDGLGRLTSVCEVTSTNLAGSSGTPAACGLDIGATGFLTSYNYDVLGNLLAVAQGAQQQYCQINSTWYSRCFSYDSLSRLLTATNPESGQTSYTYDANGNVATKTDARNITTTYAYDALERMTGKSYSDSTPAASFVYDACPQAGCPSGVTPANAAGRLVESYDASAQTFESYDAMGRVADEWQCAPLNCSGTPWHLNAEYDLLGDVTSRTNGVGVTFTQTFNAAGQLGQVTSSWNDGQHPGTLLQGTCPLNTVCYNAIGDPVTATLGNGATEAYAYNNRAQLQSLVMSGASGTPGTGSGTTSGSEQSIAGQGAAPGAGSGTASGAEQEIPPVSAVAGSGSVTVNGSEGSYQVAGTGSSSTVYVAGNCDDSCDGMASVTVDGYEADAFYGSFESPLEVAQDLADALTGSGEVNAYAANVTSGVAKVVMTSTDTGSGTNYSVFCDGGGTWEMSPCPDMEGGEDAYDVYDSGTVGVTVGGHTSPAASYGQGSSSSAIAQALANNVNGDGSALVSATWNGSNGLTLTAKTAGGGTDYSLAVSQQSNNPSHFNPPSFTMGDSGGTLTGGANAIPAVYDTGTAWVTVNGCEGAANYGSSDNPNTVAANVAAAVNANCSAWVTAAASGATVNLTAKTTGTGSNYSLSAGSSTSQPGNFGSASFAIGASGANLTGGANGTTVYDTGTAWITVNGCQGVANYGQGDTPATVASSIAAALNATCSSWVTAAADGTTVGLTAAQTGGDTDYSLSSGSSTSQPGNFSQASFSVGASGGSLVSGSNPTSYSYSLTYAPDGNVTAASDSVNGNWTYSYDDFNRLVGSSCSANCPDGQSAQAFSYVYDRYANRWQQNVTAGSGPQPTATFNNTKNQLDGYSYDPDGNLLNDGAHWYTYDAESRIIAVDGGSVATYVYDAQGRRVQKTTASGAVYYVYAITGEQVAEVNSSGSVNREEVYAGGKHLATYTNNTTYFNHADWLGTERMRTTVSASSCETIRSLAFGDGEATTGSCSDASPMHFTGKERDSESGLDNFGARYNASTMGRFMTPDPLLNSGRPWNPQTWNRYSYARNNPLSIVDPTGLYDLNNTCASDDKKCNKQFQQHANDLKKGLENLQKKVDKMKDGTEKTRLGNSLKALGTEGDHNGVNVAFGATKDGSAATTDPIFDQSSGKYSGFNVTIDPSKESNGANGWAIDAAHEGTHVSDYENFELNPATSMQPFQIEYRGYQTSAWAAQALGFDNISYRGIQIWNSSWGAVDRQTLQDRGITNVVNDANHPEVQPHNPFPNQ